ncbi:hypothetical protein GCM10010449_06050 [Streptomyces rectiviolaceus]|uniref:Uncharacterized protein n=1 Tax=Streptomyces rectiviolaceus TaxID=332591 RepID=A0ABP6M7B2_9ACTN
MTNNLDTLATALYAATDDLLQDTRTWRRGGQPWDSGGSGPRATSTDTYPVHFEGREDPKPAPRPTVSYPIRFEDR